MIIAALIFMLLGIVIRYGKMYNLMAGYNTMSKEEQEKVDAKGISIVFFNGMFGMAFMIFIGYGIAYYFQMPSLEHYFFFGSLLVGMSYILIVSNSKKYRK
jgi:Domain of unknown function (DUF3784)